MRGFAVGVASSVVASGITYMVFAAANALSLPFRLLIVTAVLAAGVVIAWRISRQEESPRSASMKVGTDIDTGGNLAIEGLRGDASGDVEIGSRLEADGNVNIKDIKLTRSEDSL